MDSERSPSKVLMEAKPYDTDCLNFLGITFRFLAQMPLEPRVTETLHASVASLLAHTLPGGGYPDSWNGPAPSVDQPLVLSSLKERNWQRQELNKNGQLVKRKLRERNWRRQERCAITRGANCC